MRARTCAQFVPHIRSGLAPQHPRYFNNGKAAILMKDKNPWEFSVVRIRAGILRDVARERANAERGDYENALPCPCPDGTDSRKIGKISAYILRFLNRERVNGEGEEGRE